MFKKEAIFMLFFLCLPVLGLIVALVTPTFMKHDLAPTYAAMLKTDHRCPNGAIESVERWGKSGYARFCLKNGVKHGQWVGWENQYKSIEGFYVEGRRHGQWLIWHKDGTKYRVIEYREGTEVSNKLLRD